MITPQLGERDRCPHCGVIADVEPATRLKYRCRVCGGPRVPLDSAEIERSGRERKALKQAQRLRFRHAAWLVAAVALGGLGLLSLLVTLGVLLVVSPGIVASGIAMLAAAVPLLLAAYAAQQTRRLSCELTARLTEAWRAVAEDVVAHDGTEVDSASLAMALRIEDDQAQRLLTDLSVHDVVQARVTDSGDLVFSKSDAHPKLRVESMELPAGEPISDTPDEEVAPCQSAVVDRDE